MITIFATGGAMMTPNLIASISFINERHIGAYISTQTSVNSTGQVLGPLLGMWFYSLNGSVPYFFIAIVLILVTVLTLPELKRSRTWNNNYHFKIE